MKREVELIWARIKYEKLVEKQLPIKPDETKTKTTFL